jgi:hypothetical protein
LASLLPLRGDEGSEPVREGTESQSNADTWDQRFIFAVIGIVLGAVVGFLFRPSVFLIGQLPFSIVILRGANLSGMDAVLVPAAQASFNQMLFLAVVGGGLGFGIGVARSLKGKQSSPLNGVGAVPSTGSSSSPSAPTDLEVLSNETVLNLTAAGLGDDVILQKMKRCKCEFALTSSDLAQLKKNGVSDRVIAGMLQHRMHG